MEFETPFVLSLMGRAELRDRKGTLVNLRTRKTLLVLAVLTHSAGQTFRREEIANTVWEGAEPNAARESLRTALTALRKFLPDHLLADRNTLTLLPGAVELLEETGYPGDFMPGYDTDWVIERRLRLRAEAVENLLTQSREAADPAEALAFANRACEIDSLDPEASARRVELLNASGKAQHAEAVRTAYRSRALREFGAVPEPIGGTPAHPLLAAAEWTLEQNPDEACAMLAATQSQWFTLSVEKALDLHQRVLLRSTRPSRDRRLVEGGTYALLTLNGKAGNRLPEIEQAYERAIADGELPLANRLGDATAYAHLSRGNFPSALAWAEKIYAFAQKGEDPVDRLNAETTLAIIQQHVGNEVIYDRRIALAKRLFDESTSTYAVASAQMMLASCLVEHGKLDRGSRLLEDCRKFNRSLLSERIEPWLLLGEARFYELSGDFTAASSLLERMKELAPAAGQSAVASADDHLLRVNCQLREYDRAAEALARVALYRKGLGTVPSVHERRLMAPAVQKIKQRLSNNDIEAAFRRARKPAPTI